MGTWPHIAVAFHPPRLIPIGHLAVPKQIYPSDCASFLISITSSRQLLQQIMYITQAWFKTKNKIYCALVYDFNDIISVFAGDTPSHNRLILLHSKSYYLINQILLIMYLCVNLLWISSYFIFYRRTNLWF